MRLMLLFNSVFNRERRTVPMKNIILLAILCAGKPASAQVSGYKTIPGDYATIVAAVAALNSQGVGAGGVIIDVLQGTGPYTGQVNFAQIAGASAANPIIFNGNGNTIQFATALGNKHVVELDGTDFLTLDNFTIVTTNASYGHGIWLHDQANNNTISNCNINLSNVTSTNSNYSLGIGLNNSTTIPNGGNNGHNNTFSGNTITGGYRSIFIAGTSANKLTGNVVVNNILSDFYSEAIFLEENDGTIISGNDIQRPTRTNEPSACAGILAETGNVNLLIDRNKIHDTHTGGSNGTFAGIYFDGCDAPVGSENRITNNLLYKFNSATGAIYALYNTGSNGTWFYHNTVVLNHTGSTSGVTRGFYQTTSASNIEVKNNVFYITRSGSGAKHVMYFNTTGSSIASNNNVLYMNAPAGTNRIGRYGTTEFATFANWKTANSAAYDQASTDVDPQMTNAAMDDYSPTNIALDNIGAPVGVPVDLNNSPRSSVTPDPGAYEFLTVPLPLSVRLLSFSAAVKSRDVNLTWAVAEEKDVAFYVVERSVDGVTFAEAGREEARENTVYDYTDRGAEQVANGGRLYYRLKMTEMSGVIAYSKIAIADFRRDDQSLSVYPNPFSQSIHVKVTTEKAGSYTLTIKDIYGRTVASQSAMVAAGTNVIEVAGADRLAAGTYFVMVAINGRMETRTLIK